MEWLNIHQSILRSPEYLGSEPVDRATWLNLMGYCAEQENGGRIEGASAWGDRKWMQIVGITKAEISRESALWRWEDGVVEVFGYPREKEEQVRAKRELAAQGARKRWSKRDQVALPGTLANAPKSDSERNSIGNAGATGDGNSEGNSDRQTEDLAKAIANAPKSDSGSNSEKECGKERKGKEEEAGTTSLLGDKPQCARDAVASNPDEPPVDSASLKGNNRKPGESVEQAMERLAASKSVTVDPEDDPVLKAARGPR